MKAAHKTIVTKASKLDADLNEKIDASLKVDRQLAKLQDEITALRSEISEIETEAADAGLSVDELHEALAELKAPKKKA